MAGSYTPIVTLLGQAKIADTIANDGTITMSHLAVGDGGGSAITPLETDTSLTNEVWRGSITSAGRDVDDPTKVIFTATIPLEAGPFIIREIAIFTSDGEMFAIGAYPEQNKPTAAQGAVSSIEVEFVIVVAETANVTVAINPSSLIFLNNFARIPFYAVDAITNDAPADPATGDMVIVGTNPNGVFAGNAGALAQWNGSLWLLAEPPLQTIAGVGGDVDYYRFTAAGWVPFSATQSAPGLVTLGLFERLPIFPEIVTATGKIAITSAGGSVSVDAAQIIRWRGFRDFSTDLFDSGDRSFATAASKTYHLRWHAPGTGDAANAANYPNGRFVLKDLAASGYNPSAKAETDASFDSTYDDVLLARVVTNGSNVATVTALINRHRLATTVYANGTNWQDAGINNARADFTATLDWARTPDMTSYSFARIAMGDSMADLDTVFYAPGAYPTATLALPKTRYGFAFTMMLDFATGISLGLNAQA